MDQESEKRRSLHDAVYLKCVHKITSNTGGVRGSFTNMFFKLISLLRKCDQLRASFFCTPMLKFMFFVIIGVFMYFQNIIKVAKNSLYLFFAFFFNSNKQPIHIRIIFFRGKNTIDIIN